MPILGVIASAKTNWLDSSGFFPIATYTVPDGGSSTITFNSIPQTYKYLQIRATLRNTGSAGANINLGSGTTRRHFWFSTGAAFTVGEDSASSIFSTNAPGDSQSYNAANLIDIFEYSDTTKNKVIRALTQYETGSGSGRLTWNSWLLVNTNAVTSITITGVSNFVQNSQATLYGFK